MSEGPLLQVVTAPPGTGDGVADYAAGIARTWALRGWQSTWLVLGPPGAIAAERRTASSVRQALERSGASQVVLHLSGYGYDRTGAPGWLAEGLAGWRTGDPGRRLVVFFHELFAVAPPWRSAFWHAPAQKAVVRRLLAIADGGLTSNDAYHAVLDRWKPRRFILSPPLPIPSNIEPAAGDTATGMDERTRPWSAVVFGQPATRARVYRCLERQPPLRDALRGLLIHDVGRPLPPLAADGFQIAAHGLLADEAVARLLARARFGLIHYRGEELAKSSVFAAYARSGLTVVNLHHRPRAADGLVPGREYMTTDDIRGGPPAPELASHVSSRLAEWHGRTGLANHAQVLIDLLRGGEAGEPRAVWLSPSPPGYRQNPVDEAVARLEMPGTPG